MGESRTAGWEREAYHGCAGSWNEGKHFREGKCNGLDLESKECVFV